MRLTRHTDSALRALIYLGIHTEEAPARITDIARRMGMSEDHLAKVIARLSQLGYVETIRGRDGGARLARPASEIVVGAVVRATEDNLNLVECFDPATNQCPIAPACALAPALDEALTAFLAVLDRYTLADLVAKPRGLTKLLIA
ncbi:Rrf2 family transcriptional regulator [Pseudogemmatithrix spongiicola]|uniref:Rrf2 family transcriptional regulator n=1 Tax=Pseudogemmatithrix spongiicola TaxID=3062599 RepID=A0AA49K1I3_9BACT|nr:Rrf2 family transcriptional regulator [Gemmatimonadaceae bacterium 'strain 138']WKW15707.1 Rrf2 family transcriptional regulator [Gemmatimonadaceae bacterium 'strain 318']